MEDAELSAPAAVACDEPSDAVDNSRCIGISFYAVSASHWCNFVNILQNSVHRFDKFAEPKNEKFW